LQTERARALVERREIDTGVWMPTRVRLTGEVRALFRKANIDYDVEWFDYQKLGDASFPLNTGIKH